jgi:hypothetical protein
VTPAPARPPEVEAVLAALSTAVGVTSVMSSELDLYNASMLIAELAWELQLTCRGAHQKRMEALSASVRALQKRAPTPDPSVEEQLAALGL